MVFLDIDLQVLHNSVDITSYVLNYTRELDLCSGVGTVLLVLDPTAPSLSPGDSIVAFEGGNKVGTYAINEITKNWESGFSVLAQDPSKQMQEYFLDAIFNANGASSRWWIGWILDRAKVNYNFTVAGSGYLLPEDDGEQFGFIACYDMVINLMKQSGWYFYFDGEGVCQIGDLKLSWSNPSGNINTSDGSMLLEELISEDSLLRNRVVVLGGASAVEVDDLPGPIISAELVTVTPWDRDDNDKRTIVYSNYYIRDEATAWILGKQLLDEFSQNISMKTYSVAGYVSNTIGDVLYCDTKIYNGLGMLSNLSVSITAGGLVTTLVFDRRCPRIFAYWSTDTSGEYVYVGTDGSGVWRKPLDEDGWIDFSSGLTNLEIRDMKIKNGFFVCTTSDYRAYRIKVLDASWTALTPTGFVDEDTDTTYDLEDLVTHGCAINELTGEYYVGYTHTDDARSWIVYFNADNTYTIRQVKVDEEFSFSLFDIDTNNNIVVASVETREVRNQGFITSGSNDFGQHAAVLPEDEVYTVEHFDTPVEHVFTDKQDNTYLSYPCWDGEKIWFRDVFRTPSVEYALRYWNPVTDDSDDFFTSNAQIRNVGTWGIDEVVTFEDSDYLPETRDIVTYGDFGSGFTKVIASWTFPSSSFWYNEYTDYMATYTKEDGTKIGVAFSSQNIIKASTGWFSIEKFFVHFFEWGSTSITTIELNLPPVEGTIVEAAYAACRAPAIGNGTLVAPFQLVTSDNDGGFRPDFTSYLMAIKVDLENETAVIELRSELVPYYYSERPQLMSFCAYDRASDGFYFNYTIDPDEEGDIVSYIASIHRTSTGITPFRLEEYQYAEHCILGTERSYYIDNYNNIKELYGNSTVASVGVYEDWVCSYKDDISGDFLYFKKDDGIYNTNGEEVIPYTGPAWIGDSGYPVFFGDTLFMVDPGGLGGAKFVVYTESSPTPIPDITTNIALRTSPTTSGIDFQEVNTIHGAVNIEISRDAPICFFGESSVGNSLIYLTDTALSGTFSLVPETISISEKLEGIQDVRIVDVLGLPNTSKGWNFTDPKDYARYIIVSQPSGEDGLASIYQGEAFEFFTYWQVIDTFSGNVHRLETTNYGESPYVFTTLSGYPSTFWQKYPDAEDFINYSTDIPLGNVTVIRTDDRI